MEVILLIFIIGVPQVIVAINFTGFLINGNHLVNDILLKILEIMVLFVDIVCV